MHEVHRHQPADDPAGADCCMHARRRMSTLSGDGWQPLRTANADLSVGLRLARQARQRSARAVCGTFGSYGAGRNSAILLDGACTWASTRRCGTFVWMFAVATGAQAVIVRGRSLIRSSLLASPQRARDCQNGCMHAGKPTLNPQLCRCKMAGVASTSGRTAAPAVGGVHALPAGGRQASFSAVISRLQRKQARRQGCRMAAAAVVAMPETPLPTKSPAQRPDAAGRFGRFGGKYVPETLIAALAQLEKDYAAIQSDPDFQASGLGYNILFMRSQPGWVCTDVIAFERVSIGPG